MGGLLIGTVWVYQPWGRPLSKIKKAMQAVKPTLLLPKKGDLISTKHCRNSRGVHLRPQMGVFLKCELSMVAKTGNNQAQFPEVADST